ncbi:MAG: Ig-like domain-containing protein [Lachnospiraceae bacterium]|nr:Ig-like domain-containing protein [Lachnospiraceae bacterium]
MELTRCQNCMAPLEQGTSICPNCGYDARTERAEDVLCANSVLQGKYLAGREIGRGKFGITYVGRDLEEDENVVIREYFPEGIASRDGSRSARVSWNLSCDESKTKRRVEQALNLELNAIMDGEGFLKPTEVLDAFWENETAYLVADFAAGSKPEAVESAFAVSAEVTEQAADGGKEAAVAESERNDGNSVDVEAEDEERSCAVAEQTPTYSDSGETIRAGDFFYYGADNSGNSDSGKYESPNGGTDNNGSYENLNSEKENGGSYGNPDGGMNAGGFNASAYQSGATQPFSAAAANGFTESLLNGWTDSRLDPLSDGTGNGWDSSTSSGSKAGNGEDSGETASRKTGKSKKKKADGGSKGENGRKKRKTGFIAAIAAVCVLILAAVIAVVVYRGNKVDSITVAANPDTLNYYAGQSFDPQGMELEVTYLSGKTETVFGDENGEVTFEPASFTKVGEVSVEISYGKGNTTLTVTVSDVEIALAGSSLSMYTGDVKTMTVTTKPADAAVTWSSSDETVATVSQEGVITATGIGEADITASTPSGSKTSEAVCTVTVNEASVRLNQSSLTLYAGETETLKATVSPSGYGIEVSYASSDSSVAAVDEAGNIEALQEGTATITATILWQGSTYTAECSVTVQKTRAQIAADQAYEEAELGLAAAEEAIAVREQAWLAEDAASEAAEKAQEAAKTGKTLNFTSGATYQGETNGSARDGYGVWTSADGTYSYAGEWVDDDMAGYGIFYYSDGGYCAGEWKDYEWDGYGTYYSAEGNTYYCRWEEGIAKGYAVFLFSNGTYYAGEVEDGLLQGYGVYYWSESYYYAGQEAEGVRNGFGVCYFSSGKVYAGEWSDDVRSGYGILYGTDGEIESAGWWEDDAYVGADEADAG